MSSSKTKTPEEQAAIASAKELRERDAALAMKEYQLERAHLAARTERLRAERLAREREAAANPPPQPETARRKSAKLLRKQG